MRYAPAYRIFLLARRLPLLAGGAIRIKAKKNLYCGIPTFTLEIVVMSPRVGQFPEVNENMILAISPTPI